VKSLLSPESGCGNWDHCGLADGRPGAGAKRKFIRCSPLDADPALARLVAEPGFKAKPERILLLHLVAFDWNCPQHITPRFTEAEIAEAVQPLRERLTTLETENAELRARLAAKEGLR
jgi:hypothetical protein